MFRKMRRSTQALSREEITDLLNSETRGVMSVQGDDGYPYGIPINHLYSEEENRLYFHGAKFGHRIDAVKRDPKVSYCVYGQDQLAEGGWEYNVKSVVVFGKAVLIDDEEEIRRVCALLCEKFPCPEGYIERELEKDTKNTLLIAIDIENINGKLVNEA